MTHPAYTPGSELIDTRDEQAVRVIDVDEDASEIKVELLDADDLPAVLRRTVVPAVEIVAYFATPDEYNRDTPSLDQFD